MTNGLDPAVAALAGAVVGALAAGLSPVIVLWWQRKHELEDRRVARKREVYEQFLRRVTHLVPDYFSEWIETGSASDFTGQRERALADIRLGFLLDGSPEVVRLAEDVEAQVATFFTRENLDRIRDNSVGRGTDFRIIFHDAFHSHVASTLRALADAMREDLRE